MNPKIKSPVVYRELRQVFGPWCRKEGFRRTKSSRAEWYREHDPGDFKRRYLCFWFQVSAWSDCFTAELQLAHEPRMSHVGRERIGFLLDEATRGVLLDREAEVRGRATGEKVESWERERPSDLWFSYATAEDVAAWAEVLLPLWPSLLESFVAGRTPPEGADPC